MRKGKLTKIGIIVLLLLLFVGYMAYVKWDKSHFTVDSDAFDVKDSLEEVIKEETGRVNGSQLADQFDNIEHIDISRELPNQKRDVKIHDVWFTPQQLYVLYSVNLQKSDQTPSDIPELDFSEVTLKTENEGDMTSPQFYEPDDEDDDKHEGVVLEKRLYRSLNMTPEYTEMEDMSLKDAETFFADITNISLGKASLNKSDDDKHSIDDLAVEMPYEEDDQTLFTIPLDGKISLDNGHVLDLQELEVTPFTNTLHFSADTGEQTMQYISADLTWDGKESDDYTMSQYTVNEEKEGYSIQLMPFDDLPEQFDINVERIEYVSSKDVSLQVPADPEQEDVSQKVGEAEGTPIYFQGYEGEEPDADNRVGLKLNWQTDDDDVVFANLRHDLKNQYEGMGYKEDTERLIDSHSNILNENEKGEKPEFKNLTSEKANLMTDEKGFIIYLDESFVDDSEELHVTIENFNYGENVKDGTFHIDLPDEYVSDE